jgi:hypothetical protein
MSVEGSSSLVFDLATAHTFEFKLVFEYLN